MEEFRKALFKPIVTDLTHSRILRLFSLLIVVAIPLTVFVAGQTQETRNRAQEGLTPGLANWIGPQPPAWWLPTNIREKPGVPGAWFYDAYDPNTGQIATGETYGISEAAAMAGLEYANARAYQQYLADQDYWWANPDQLAQVKQEWTQQGLPGRSPAEIVATDTRTGRTPGSGPAPWFPSESWAGAGVSPTPSPSSLSCGVGQHACSSTNSCQWWLVPCPHHPSPTTAPISPTSTPTTAPFLTPTPTSIFSPTVVPPTITTAPSADSDGDGFTNAVEQTMGTNPNRACPTNTSDAAWPPDFDNNSAVTILDFSKLRVAFTNQSNGIYDRRYDLNGDGKIDIDDYNVFVPLFSTSCTVTPSPTSTPTPST